MFASHLIASNAMQYAFSNSDTMGQAICVLLFFFSVAVWVIMINKYIILRKAGKESDAFASDFSKKRNPLHLRDRAEEDHCPAARVFHAACERMESFHLETAPGGVRRALSDDEIAITKSTMEQSVEEEILRLEHGMTFLSVSVSGCPFLGLFGTVWGITIAFTNLAILGRADIQTLAPGVSGALLTTVIALFVAIPSLIGYNYIAAILKKQTVKLDNFTNDVAARLKIEQMESIQAYEKQKQD